MTEQICPVCGCTIGNKSHETEGLKYCCESRTTGQGQCVCSCCTIVENK
jgi:hypothetical protein